jgi:uncharacterized protein YaaR (DUF327 family)
LFLSRNINKVYSQAAQKKGLAAKENQTFHNYKIILRSALDLLSVVMQKEMHHRTVLDRFVFVNKGCQALRCPATR